MAKKVTYKNLKSSIGKKIRTSKGSLIWLSIHNSTPTIVWLEMKEGDHGWVVEDSSEFIGAERFLGKDTQAYYISDLRDFKDVFGDEPAYYVDEEPKTKKIFANTLSTEEIIERLQNGEVLKSEAGRTLKMIKGMLCSIARNSVLINAGAVIGDANEYYFEEEVKEEPFKITETGFYKTRGGSKVYVSMVEPAFKFGIFGVFEGSSRTFHWQETGSVFTDGQDALEDIVSKWEE